MKRKIAVLTGAGISAESGIKTFRDSGGLWEEHRIEDVASPDGWRRDKQLVLNFYNQRRKQLLACALNRAHFALAELEKNTTLPLSPKILTTYTNVVVQAILFTCTANYLRPEAPWMKALYTIGGKIFCWAASANAARNCGRILFGLAKRCL